MLQPSAASAQQGEVDARRLALQSGATEVGLYRIDGGGHTWPGADPRKAIGLTTQQVSATDQILAFFARHRLGH